MSTRPDQPTYHGSVAQAEYATDLVFGRPQALRAHYDTLRRQAIFTVQAEDTPFIRSHALTPGPDPACASRTWQPTME